MSYILGKGAKKCSLQVMAFHVNFDPMLACHEQLKDSKEVLVFVWRRHEWLDG